MYLLTSIGDFSSEIITVISALVVNVTLLIGAWTKFKAEISSNVDKINSHTDVSVTKLNGMLTNVIHSFDRPCWLKLAIKENNSIVFRMLEMNDYYSDHFGISRSQYLGKTDLEAGWSHSIAQKFQEHDLMVWASGEPATVVEVIDGKEFKFRKIRVESKNGEAKGILGYALDDRNPQIKQHHEE